MLGRAVDDEIGPQVLRIFERPRLRALLDEEIERIVDRHVGDDVDLDLQFVDEFREDVAREPVAVRILLMVHEMVGGRNLQRVRYDPGAAVGRGPEPDDLRAERDRAIVFVVREVMDRGSDRHGFRGLVTARRPFHNLLRRTITSRLALRRDCARLPRRYCTRRRTFLRAQLYSEIAPTTAAGTAGAGGSASKPQAASASSMWGGAGASTSIGGFDFESGTTTLRASNWSGQVGALAVDRVAEDRPALRSAMDAQLMRASGLGLELEPGDRRAAPCPPPLDAPKRQRLLAIGIDLHPPADLVIEAAERQIDRSLLDLRARPRRSPNTSWRSCPA